jgi:hypothetical protein
MVTNCPPPDDHQGTRGVLEMREEITMRLRRVSIAAFAMVIGSVAMADSAMAAKPRRDRGPEGRDFAEFERMCSSLGGQSIGSLDPYDNGEVECILPDGTRIRCEVEGGITVYCKRHSATLETPSGGSLVSAPVYEGPDSFSEGSYTSGISTSPNRTLSGQTATRW